MKSQKLSRREAQLVARARRAGYNTGVRHGEQLCDIVVYFGENEAVRLSVEAARCMTRLQGGIFQNLVSTVAMKITVE